MIIVFNTELIGVLFQGHADRPRCQWFIGVIVAPHGIDGVQIGRSDGAVSFQPNISFRTHEQQHIVGLWLGFHTVIEAALGADMVAYSESKELAEKGFLTSSCCPAFVTYIEKTFPQLLPLVSHNLSPMAAVSKYIKSREPNCKVIFIGPCTAKKAEVQRETVAPYVDVAMTFEELQALFDSKDIDIMTLSEGVLDNASYFGRIFARSGGLSDAVAQALKEQDIKDFELKPCACDGIEACRAALLKKSKDRLDANFIEGMACIGGCIGGAGCLTHGERNKAEVDKYGKEAYEKTITDAISMLK